MSDTASIESRLAALKEKYIISLPEKVHTISQIWHSSRQSTSLSDNSLESCLHKLAGSAGMYEEDQLGELARSIEINISTHSENLTDEVKSQIDSALSQLNEMVSELTSPL